MFDQIRGLHRNETGALSMEQLLILAAVALPLLALLIFFGKNVVEFAQGAWEEVVGSENAVPTVK